MQVVSWNVNSVKARLEHLLFYLKTEQPDVICLQELKSVDENFPHEAIAEAGYNFATFGQKTYNGVAILSRHPIEDVHRGLPGFEDDQSRYIEAVISNGALICRVASIYCPNGNPVEGGQGEKYLYKLAFMDALYQHAKSLLSYEEVTILSGDYNVIPTEVDCYAPENWRADALFMLETRQTLRRLINLGYSDGYALLHPLGPDGYTFWDYQGGAFPKNNGIRIDHHLLSPLAANLLTSARIDRYMREREKPSDHVPIAITLSP